MITPIHRAFLADKADYYIEAFKKISQKKNTWNWAAFFLGIGWLCYRRMYLYAAIFGVLITVETVIEIIFSLPTSVTNAVSIGIWVGSGFVGNAVYKIYVDKQIASIESLPLSEEELLTTAAARGKPGVLMGFIGFLVFFGLMYGAISLIPIPD